MSHPACPMKETEADFQSWVADTAMLMGWMIYHARPGQDRRGKWVTPLMGQPGFPDLVLARGRRLIFAELKSEDGDVTIEQSSWLAVLDAGPAEAYLWRPSDRRKIMEILGLRVQ